MKNSKKLQAQAYLPNDILFNILQRLPLKSLLQFQCVAKSWRSNLITHPSFRLINSNSTSYSIFSLYCLTDEYAYGTRYQYRLKFEQMNQFDANSNVNVNDNDDVHDDIDDQLTGLHYFHGCQVYGSSNGLICFPGFNTGFCEDVTALGCKIMREIMLEGSRRMYLWNPGINRYKAVDLLPPSMDQCSECPSRFHYRLHIIGFGFCGIKGFNDYRLVHVAFHSDHSPGDDCSSSGCYCRGHVYVYSLAFDSWKSLPSANVPSCLARYDSWEHRWGSYAFVGGVYYWLICHDSDESYSLVAFDMVNETFLNKVKLPKLFRPSYVHRLYLFELSGSVALYEAVDEFRKGCLWVSTDESTNDHNGGKAMTWIKLVNIMVDDVKELLMDERLPYSLQMMLKHNEKIMKVNECTYYSEGVTYSEEHAIYCGTYINSLALLGMVDGIKSFSLTKGKEEDVEDGEFFANEDN